MESPPSDGFKQLSISSFYPVLTPRNKPTHSQSPVHGEEEQNFLQQNAISQISRSTDLPHTDSKGELAQARDPRPQRSPAEMNRRMILSQVAKETKSLLPGLLDSMPHAPKDGYLISNPSTLGSTFCPRFNNTTVKVVNGDSFDVAINLANSSLIYGTRDAKPVCVLNMANQWRAGGGWLNGAIAQEEELCYRSSLSFTLKLRYYPLGDFDAVYSPTVVVFRDNFQRGHRLMDIKKPDYLPVVSVVSVAALQGPELDLSFTPPRYKHNTDRDFMKSKMRVILRVAAYKKHRRLVLGAFGCGAFFNPKHEVADCWAEVLKEKEFKGWWEHIVFAVIDDSARGAAAENGNLSVFQNKLDGLQV
ncbi:hypothetical protein ASPWEDRAFT_166602 [Aspergillus wentii DTO 134E9]|uniref:Microbial-type PARG catalytic domain-containing protein n=1 Tax=Aspergillus wentii DTO 134E9 TaxID=1073089 RepID=A0A1L9S039_ASPWE|nr:uncharacterized protein ASPWEDRAFT_166602 [Aspergillus wentii DTO 134E9]KAI9932948.1 hypothetical protein MW887_009200 [Aspergillus wentii]OJJ40535.1 hypothetical protein ASPWEDRAFT_166602 [Aspergillus wentii DTO 134E9]